MLKLIAVAAASLAIAAMPVPFAHAQGDPHIPNGNSGWCAGGDHRDGTSGGGRYCLGVQYDDGSFYAQQWVKTDPHNIFSGAWTWSDYASCQFMVGGSVQGGKPYSTALPGCGGGPSSIRV